MNSIDLSTALSWNQNFQDQNFVLISETERTDAQWLVHFLLSRELSGGGRNVCLLALAQNFEHYDRTTAKLGANLKSSREKGNFIIVENLKNICTKFAPSLLPENVNLMNVHNNVFDLGTCSTTWCLDDLFGEIQKAKGMFKDLDAPFTLIMDDLSSLLNVGVETKEILRFIECCQRLDNCRLEVVVFRDSDDEDLESNCLYSYLVHCCDLLLDVDGLATGVSKEVHGEIVIKWRDPFLKTTQKRAFGHSTSSKYHFKIFDNNIKLFAPGSSVL